MRLSLRRVAYVAAFISREVGNPGPFGMTDRREQGLKPEFLTAVAARLKRLRKMHRSSIVAALTFLAISFSEFRAFREFGVIAAVGMIVVFAAYFFFLPGMLGLATRWGWKPSTRVVASSSEVAQWLPKYFKPTALIIGLLIAYFLALMPGIKFNYDFHALEDSSLPVFAMSRLTV